jgi:PAS domain S-box-containing protein
MQKTIVSPPTDREGGRQTDAHRKDHRPPSSGAKIDPDALHEKLLAIPHELNVLNEELQRHLEAYEESKRQLEELRSQYASLFDFAPIGYLTIDSRLRIVEANITVATMIGCRRSGLIGRTLSDFIHQDDQNTFRSNLLQAIAANGCTSCDLTMLRVDGTRFTARFRNEHVPDSPDIENAVRIDVTDVTERLRHQRNQMLIHDCLEIANRPMDFTDLLRDIATIIKQNLKCDAVGIRILDDKGDIPYEAYDGFPKSFYEKESPLSIHTDRCMCIQVIKGAADTALPFFTPGGSFFINGTSRFLSTVSEAEKGETRNICHQYGFESVVLIPVRSEGAIMGLIHAADRREDLFPLQTVENLEELARHLGIMINRVVVAEKLKRSNEELNFVTSKLLRAQEDEQRRVAMELHDQTGQDLNFLKLRLSTLYRQLHGNPEDLRAELKNLLSFTDTVIENVRRLSHGLSPSILEDLGLEPALKELIDDFAAHSDITIEGNFHPLKDFLWDFDTQVAIYRIVQEILSNISKHAKADNVRISVERSDRLLDILISDDGRGFHPSTLVPMGMNKGLGLSTMQMRARLIGATLHIDSRDGSGTHVRFSLPLER